MDPKIVFCYIWFFNKGEPLENAFGEEADDHGQIQYWIGVELGHRNYKLEVRDTNEFLRKYLIK